VFRRLNRDRALSGVLRAFAALLLATYVTYVPWHLSQECHAGSFTSPAAASHEADFAHKPACHPHKGGDNHGHHHHHVPHPEGEHVLDFVIKPPDSLPVPALVSLTASSHLPAPTQAARSLPPSPDEFPPPSLVLLPTAPRGPPLV
jgi:hypothetical protein